MVKRRPMVISSKGNTLATIERNGSNRDHQGGEAFFSFFPQEYMSFASLNLLQGIVEGNGEALVKESSALRLLTYFIT